MMGENGEMWERMEHCKKGREKYGEKIAYLIHGVSLTGLCIQKKIKLDHTYMKKFKMDYKLKC